MKSLIISAFALLLSLSIVKAETVAHTKGGGNYTLGIALAKTVGLTPIPNSGTAFYIPKVDSGVMDFGLSNPSQLFWAYNGLEMFDKEYKNLRFVANLVEFKPAVIVRNNSRFKTVFDLKGARIPSGFRGSPLFQKNFTDILANGGFTWDDVIPVPVSTFKESVDAFEAGRVDVLKGTLGGANNLRFNATLRGGIRLLCLNPFDQGEYSKEWPGQYLRPYDPNPSMPAVRKKGCTGIAYRYTVWSNKNVSNDFVRDVVLKLYNNAEEFKAASALTSQFERENMAKYDRIPMHEGALSAYKTLGLR